MKQGVFELKTREIRRPCAALAQPGHSGGQRAAGMFLVLALLGSVSGCSPHGVSPSQAQAVINKGLAATSNCIAVPVEVEYRAAVHGTSLALKTLQVQGMVQPGPVTVRQYIGPPQTQPGFVFTDAAKALVIERDNAVNSRTMPCVRNGRFEVSSLEAIDIAPDAGGRMLASVRARVKFMPENWLAKTRDDPAWSSYWSGIEKTQATQWLYTLLKSGDDLFYGGAGQPLK